MVATCSSVPKLALYKHAHLDTCREVATLKVGSEVIHKLDGVGMQVK